MEYRFLQYEQVGQILPFAASAYEEKTFRRQLCLPCGALRNIRRKISLGFASACNRLYNKLEAEDKLKSVKNRSELSAAIFLDAGVKLPRLKKREDILKFFNADGKKILEFYGV